MDINANLSPNVYSSKNLKMKKEISIPFGLNRNIFGLKHSTKIDSNEALLRSVNDNELFIEIPFCKCLSVIALIEDL
jgi:hypothetical protein